MEMIEAVVLREPWEVIPRLQTLMLPKNKLLEVRDIAVHEAAGATAFHAANAAGTFSYHHGIWALRDRFVGTDWSVDRTNGVETIRNEQLKLVVGFCNVDHACDDNHKPQPRTKKGSGSERATFAQLFDNLPEYVLRPSGEWQFFYLMVDSRGAAELSRPIVKRGKFTSIVERIYLSDIDDFDGGIMQTAPDPIVEFDPQISRKA